MFGVVARIVAAAVVIAVVQHHVTQIYAAWQQENREHEVGPQKYFPVDENENATSSADAAQRGDGDAEGRKDDAGSGSSSGGRGGGGNRSFFTATAAGAAATATARGSSLVGLQGAVGGKSVVARGMVMDQRSVGLALRAARRITRA